MIFALHVLGGRRQSTGLEAIAPFLALAEPIANFVRPMPYPQMYPPEDPDYHPTAVSQDDVRRLDRPR